MGLDMYLTNSKGDEVGYWRKANAIHNWFVQNVQNGEDECNKFEVSFEKLQELASCCKKVLENPELASNLLPTTSGFFFGGTDYDKWYLNSLWDTLEIISKCSKDETYYYQSSW